MESVSNDDSNILYETDFLIIKNWRLYFFLTDFLNFFFILQSPEQTWVACPMFLCRLLNPGFFSTTIVYNLTIRHLSKLERSLWPSFSRFWARKCDFLEKTQKKLTSILNTLHALSWLQFKLWHCTLQEMCSI